MGFIDTVEYIVVSALKQVRAIPPAGGVQPNQLAEMKSSALNSLNSIVQSLQSEELYFWQSSSTSLPLVANQSTYNINAKILYAYGFYVRDSQNMDRFIEVIGDEEYSRIATKGTTGMPAKLALNVGVNSYSLIVYPVPDKSYTLYYNVITSPSQYSTITDPHNFPAYWTDALVWLLASEIAGMYDVGIDERAFIERKAQYKLAYAKSFRVREGSLYIVPPRR